jgi:nicotinamidase-related amidase
VKALLIIDVQGDYTRAPRRLGFPNQVTQRMITHINQSIGSASQSNMPIIYIRQVHNTWLSKAYSKLFAGFKVVLIPPTIATLFPNHWAKKQVVLSHMGEKLIQSN